jgi:hypothetical protein
MEKNSVYVAGRRDTEMVFYLWCCGKGEDCSIKGLSENYLKSKNQPLKVLLAHDNAPGHLVDLYLAHSNIQVICPTLSPHWSTQGLTTLFNSFCTCCIGHSILVASEGETSLLSVNTRNRTAQRPA